MLEMFRNIIVKGISNTNILLKIKSFTALLWLKHFERKFNITNPKRLIISKNIIKFTFDIKFDCRFKEV